MTPIQIQNPNVLSSTSPTHHNHTHPFELTKCFPERGNCHSNLFSSPFPLPFCYAALTNQSALLSHGTGSLFLFFSPDR